jgi:hypothetical protein
MYEHDASTLLSFISDLAKRGLEAETAALAEAERSAAVERSDHVCNRQRVLKLRRMQARREAQAAAEATATRKLRAQLDEAARLIRERQTVLRTEGYQAHVFPDRTRYEGEWRNSCIHGQGSLTSADRREEYDGEFFLGVRSGQGRQSSMTFGTVFTGKWYENRRSGRGELIEPEGVYRGDFMDGQMTGINGEYAYVDGQNYRGGWLNGMYDGFGVLSEASGSRYEGQWSMGKRHGKGTHTSADGTEEYNGDWEKDRRHGRGQLTCPDFTYVGEWVCDTMSGLGTKTFANGAVYEGALSAGEPHGHGTFVTCPPRQGASSSAAAAAATATAARSFGASSTSATSTVAPTTPLSGSRDGAPAVAQAASAAGESGAASATAAELVAAAAAANNVHFIGAPRYSGEWRRGLRHGRGQYTYPHRRIMYDGEWDRGAKSGRGTLTLVGQGAVVGVWRHDVLDGDAVLLRINEHFSHPVRLTFRAGVVVARQDDDVLMLPRIVSLLPDDSAAATPLAIEDAAARSGRRGSRADGPHGFRASGGGGGGDDGDDADDLEEDTVSTVSRGQPRIVSGTPAADARGRGDAVSERSAGSAPDEVARASGGPLAPAPPCNAGAHQPQRPFARRPSDQPLSRGDVTELALAGAHTRAQPSGTSAQATSVRAVRAGASDAPAAVAPPATPPPPPPVDE